MAVVEVRKLVKHFDAGRVHAIDGVDLAAADGEYLVLLGPSGCGKTTLLRMIAGLEQPTSGDVLIENEVVTGFPPRVRKIAMVFQSYALYPHKSVLANIVFPLKAVGMGSAEREAKARWAAELLGIQGLLGRKPRQLSGGERQRVALARALVREPHVFLLDEPLSNLDAKLRASARDELRRFQREIGTTTIYVTHDQAEAMGLGDRIVVLDNGTVCQVGPPVEVYDDPASTFVATFIGSPPMNLVPRDGVLVGFRPEHLLPAGEVRAVDRVNVSLTVERIEHLSGDRHVYGTVARIGEPTRVVARLPATVDTELVPGRTHDFAVDSARVRFFDADSGLRRSPLRLGG
ncbi:MULTISPECIES: ABC transporter ATP-binding protein [Saccharopolyspora]|uniref:ABC transporter ATP-binding protein n=1 Tax=Saccharopolyspora elongata TaxID=2530387 RepID=A0A4R4YSA2_9PSEU|nr:ABC transporter ATP-binding protein [Saccharopolyspora elongata]TDD48106.1 ABC transporter ATP-binding protein [Saccharopolyspora elongata]